MRIALAQISPCVGDFSGNLVRILDYWKQADEQGAELVVFPELAISGYPPHDLLDRPEMLEWSNLTLQKLLKQSANLKCAALVGYVGKSPKEAGKRSSNRASLIHEGKVIFSQDKMLLPTYDVFDEARYFEPAQQSLVCKWKEYKIAVTICEDLWGGAAKLQSDVPLYGKTPLDGWAQDKPDFIVSLSASPYEFQKQDTRLVVHSEVAKKFSCPVIYVNQCGATDEILFDGQSFVLNSKGELIEALPAWTERLQIVEILNDSSHLSQTIQKAPKHQKENELQVLAEGLVVGIREYFKKTGFSKAVLGLSGGIDSAVVACLAVKALGAPQVLGVAMPSQYSSPDSLEDAEILSRNLKLCFEVRPIKFLFATAQRLFMEGLGGPLKDVAQENLQSRLRGLTLMTLSNHLNALVLTTGNKSELAMGYCTLYGDQCGAIGPIGDLLKTKVYELARWINENWGSPIPTRSIDKAPSAELKPGQTDQDSLPPYEDLDLVLHRYLELGDSVQTIEADLSKLDSMRFSWISSVIQSLERNEFKRRQAAPVLKVSAKAFGLGRRIPIAKRWQQCDSGAHERN